MAKDASILPESSHLESNGDYAADASLLEDVQKPLYKEQPHLPRLPVPSLEDTIETFLPTSLPFCKDENERKSLLEAAQNFPSQAAALQQRLLDRQSTSSSWLQLWWNQLGYLQCRTSNVLHVSYFFRLADDPTATSWTERGAAILQTAAIYAHNLEHRPADALPTRQGRDATTTDSIPLCSSQYKYLFSSCRVPRKHQDAYRVFHNQPQTQQPSKRQHHAVVAFQGQFYRIPVTDNHGPYLSRSTLESLLQHIVNKKAPTQDDSTASVPELGWLTATNRDRWAEAYQMLESIPALSKPLHDLQSGLFLLCLDDNVNIETATLEEEDRQDALRLWHGNQRHSANRWFDKSMQLVLSDTPGKFSLGYIGEHAMADGMPALSLCRALRQEGACSRGDASELVNKTSSTSTSAEIVPIFQDAFSQLSSTERESIQQAVDDAKTEFLANIAQHSLYVQRFTDYGKESIKTAGYSPDGFVQMALQLAGRRIFGTTVGTYESTQVRPFLHGRTETTRSVSVASQAFCDAMMCCSSTTTLQERRDLLDAAVQSHVTYTQKALAGKGVDRHFFGLTMLQKDDEPLPDLFQHPVYATSKRWRMSTSTLPDTAPGFGNIEPDGVGIGYDILDDRCIFTVTSEKETGLAMRMKEEIAVALNEMKIFLNPEPPRNKL